MGVSSSIVADGSVPEGVVGGDGRQQHVGVVDLVVVGHPGPDESPESLHLGVGSESGHLLGLSS